MDNAILLQEDHLSDLEKMLFLLRGNSQQGSGRTDFRANHAIIIAETMVEFQHRLQEAAQSEFVDRRSNDSRRTFAHAEMTRCTAASKMVKPLAAGRYDRERLLVSHPAGSCRQ